MLSLLLAVVVSVLGILLGVADCVVPRAQDDRVLLRRVTPVGWLLFLSLVGVSGLSAWRAHQSGQEITELTKTVQESGDLALHLTEKTQGQMLRGEQWRLEVRNELSKLDANIALMESHVVSEREQAIGLIAKDLPRILDDLAAIARSWRWEELAESLRSPVEREGLAKLIKRDRTIWLAGSPTVPPLHASRRRLESLIWSATNDQRGTDRLMQMFENKMNRSLISDRKAARNKDG